MKKVFSALKFVAGFTSNLACQSARCIANLVCSALLALSSSTMFALALLQFVGGGRKQSAESASIAWKMIRSSIEAGVKSLMQAAGVVTLLSPLVRGAQACSESIAPKGFIAPAGSGRNFWQVVFGINSWEEAPSVRKAIPTPAPSSQASKRKMVRVEPMPQVVIADKPKPKKASKPRKASGWPVLAHAYLNAKTFKEMNRIRAKMALNFPAEYARALNEARRSKKTKSRAA